MSKSMRLTDDQIIFKDDTGTEISSISCDSNGITLSSSDTTTTKVEGDFSINGKLNTSAINLEDNAHDTIQKASGEYFQWDDSFGLSASDLETIFASDTSLYSSDSIYDQIQKVNLNKSWINKCIIGTSTPDAAYGLDSSGVQYGNTNGDDFCIWQGTHILGNWVRLQSVFESTSYIVCRGDTGNLYMKNIQIDQAVSITSTGDFTSTGNMILNSPRLNSEQGLKVRYIGTEVAACVEGNGAGVIVTRNYDNTNTIVLDSRNLTNHPEATIEIDGVVKESSDDRIKSHETSISDGLATVDKLNPVTYYKIPFNEDPNYEVESTDGFPKHSGYIAQSVKAIPELDHLVTENETSGLHFLNYTGVQPYLCKAIQELHAIVKLQQEKIEALESKIESM